MKWFEFSFCHSVVFCIKCIKFDAGILCTSWSQYFQEPLFAHCSSCTAAFTLVLRALLWLYMEKSGFPWTLVVEDCPLEAKFRESVLCARLTRTWCCDIRSKQNGNIFQKQTQHPGGTHSTRLHFETRWRCLSADGPFYVCTPHSLSQPPTFPSGRGHQAVT